MKQLGAPPSLDALWPLRILHIDPEKAKTYSRNDSESIRAERKRETNRRYKRNRRELLENANKC